MNARKASEKLSVAAMSACILLPILVVMTEWWPAIFGVMICVLLIAAGAIVFVRNVREGYDEANREDRQQRGCCLACGYRLKGNVSGVCPECGTARGNCSPTP